MSLSHLSQRMGDMRLGDERGGRGPSSSPSAPSTSSGARYVLAAKEDTQLTIDPTAPPASDGGFRPLSQLDVLPIDVLLPTIAASIWREPLTIVQAATGSGKSSRIPATILREWYATHNVEKRQHQRKEFSEHMREKGIALPLSERQYPPALRLHPHILVTQPRRIAAISLSKRVASELGESEVGHSVGFKIGHESVFHSRRTKLIFVTTGWLLQKLVHNPSYLAECSHLVLDEIHERGLDADILYVVLRRIIKALVAFDREQRNDVSTFPSLVLMSATFNSNLFGKYFAPIYKDVPGCRHYADHTNIKSINIETRRYPVSIFHLEDILHVPMLAANRAMLAKLLPENPEPLVQQLVQKMSKPVSTGTMSASIGPISNSLLHLLSWLCASLALCHRSDPEEGCCILVFFPGLQEIEAAAQMIDEDLLKRSYTKKVRITEDEKGNPVEEEIFDEEEQEDGSSSWRHSSSSSSKYELPPDVEERAVPLSSLVELMILHSMVEDQLKVFEPVPAGQTRVILATNIAESSVTLPYVKYVLDLGAHKEVEYNDRFMCEMLVKKYTSQASAQQRAGRCGRLSPGTVMRLYPSMVFENVMDPYDLPELLRVSLASTILRLKMTADSTQEDEDPILDETEEANNTTTSEVDATNSKGNKSKSKTKGKLNPSSTSVAPPLSTPRFDPSVCNLNDPHSVLSECLQPPSLVAIDKAYEELIKNGAIEVKHGPGAGAVPQPLLPEGEASSKKKKKKKEEPKPKKADKKKGKKGKKSKTPSSWEDIEVSSSESESEHEEEEVSMTSGHGMLDKRTIYQSSRITPLGRFFAALPFSFHLSRLVALGVVFGPRYLLHAVVISSALSMADVFLMPMQSRGAAGGGDGGGGGGGRSRNDRDGGQDPYPLYVARTTRTRLWCDAGIGSDAIAIIRLVDAYLKYRQHLGDSGVGGSGNAAGLKRRSHLLDDWCAARGVHMKRIKTLTSAISEICYRLSALVHSEEERDALLQLAAMCGKTRPRQTPNNAPSSRAGAKPGRHYTYSTPASAVADRDSDRGNSAHNDLYHLLQTANGDSSSKDGSGAEHAAYNFHQDIMSTSSVPDDLLSLDPESVAVLQFMLTAALLPNLLMGSVKPADLGEGLPYGSSNRLNPASTFLINRIPSPLVEGRQDTLQHRPELEAVAPAFTKVLTARVPDKKMGRHGEMPMPMSSMAVEFREQLPPSAASSSSAPAPASLPASLPRLRVALDGRPSHHLEGSDKSVVPLLVLPPTEMLILYRMFNNGKFNIIDRKSMSAGIFDMGSQFASTAVRGLQQQPTTQIYTISEPKLPGKAIKWRLFSPRSPARIDSLSPISALTSYVLPLKTLKQLASGSDPAAASPSLAGSVTKPSLSGVFSDFDPTSKDATPEPTSAAMSSSSSSSSSKAAEADGKKKKAPKPGSAASKREKEAQSQKASAAAASIAADARSRAEQQIFAVAASMTVSSGATSEIRAEKVTLLPVGANAGLTSIFLSVLLQGNLIKSAEGITGLNWETRPLHFSGVLPASLEPALLKMRSMISGLLNDEFVQITDKERALAPLFLQLIRPHLRSTVKSYPSTDPAGFQKRKKLELLPPSQPRATNNNETAPPSSTTARYVPPTPATAVKTSASQAAEEYERQRQQVLERKARREAAHAAIAAAAASTAPAAAAAAAANGPSRAAEPAPTPAANGPTESKGAVTERVRVKKPKKERAGSETARPAAATSTAPTSSPAPSASPAPSVQSDAASSSSSSAAAAPSSTKATKLSESELVALLRAVFHSRRNRLRSSDVGPSFERVHHQKWKEVAPNAAANLTNFLRRRPEFVAISEWKDGAALMAFHVDAQGNKVEQAEQSEQQQQQQAESQGSSSKPQAESSRPKRGRAKQPPRKKEAAATAAATPASSQ